MPNSSCIAKCDSHHFQHPGYCCRLVIMGRKKESVSLLFHRRSRERKEWAVQSCSGQTGCLWLSCHRAEWDRLWQSVGQPTACGSTMGRRMWGSRAGTEGKIGQNCLRSQRGTNAGAKDLVLAWECWRCCSFKRLRAAQALLPYSAPAAQPGTFLSRFFLYFQLEWF